MTNNNKKSTPISSGKQSFSDAVKAYNDAANANTPNTYPLINLGKAMVNSVIRKLYDIGTDPKNMRTISWGALEKLQSLRRDAMAEYGSELENVIESASKLAYNANGDLIRETIDSDALEAEKELIARVSGDGADLLQEAICKILEETQAQKRRDGGPVDIERPYTVKRLERRVTMDADPRYKEVETVPVKESHRAVRRSVADSKIMIDAANMHTYLESFFGEDGADMTYKRIGRCYDLGGYVIDANGQRTLYTVSLADAEEAEEMEKSLNLSPIQKQWLHGRLQGLGNKQIANRLNWSENRCKGIKTEVRRKATRLGYNADADADPVIEFGDGFAVTLAEAENAYKGKKYLLTMAGLFAVCYDVGGDKYFIAEDSYAPLKLFGIDWADMRIVYLSHEEIYTMTGYKPAFYQYDKWDGTGKKTIK